MNNKIRENTMLKIKNLKLKIRGKNQRFFPRGFTLLETLVAIFIFTITVTALLSLVGDSVNSANSLKDEITASYLADEMMDYAHNDRDTIAFQHTANGSGSSGNFWQDFLDKYGYPSSLCFSNNGCEVDILQNNYIQQCMSSCSPINFYDNGTIKYYGLYGGNTYSSTKFSRQVRFVVPSGSTDQLLVVVTVKWTNRSGFVRSKTYISSLYNWGA